MSLKSLGLINLDKKFIVCQLSEAQSTRGLKGIFSVLLASYQYCADTMWL